MLEQFLYTLIFYCGVFALNINCPAQTKKYTKNFYLVKMQSESCCLAFEYLTVINASSDFVSHNVYHHIFPTQTLGGPMHSLGGPMMPQQMGMQKLGAQGSFPATWSDPSVNISLDFLSAGMQQPKPSQPTLNTMIQQQGGWACKLFNCILSVT